MSVLEQLSTAFLTVRNPMWGINENAVSTGPADDTHDMGYYGRYWNGTNTVYSGLFRDSSSSGLYRLFDGLTVQPDENVGIVNTAGLGFTHASLQVFNLITVGTIASQSTTNSVSPTTGSITTAGGLGVAQDIWVGGMLDVKSMVSVHSSTNSTSTTTGSIVASGGLGVALDVWIGGLLDVKNIINVQSTTNATSALTGSIKTAGGLGVALDTWLGGLLNVAGNLTVNGSNTTINSATTYFRDNILVNNHTSYANMKEDHGWIGERSPANVLTYDSPKVANVALTLTYTANSTSITINALAVGSGYYVGWYLRDDAKNTYALITLDTDNGGNHTFTLDAGFPDAGTVGVSTYSLYNHRYVGWIWDESMTQLSAFSFPREDKENKLAPAATDGSAPDFANVSVNNLNVNGSLTVAGGISASPNPIPTLTITISHTITTIEITSKSIIYANPSANITITMPLLSSLTLSGYAYRITIVNVSDFEVTVAANGSDTIEGKSSYVLKKKWFKQTIISTPFLTAWVIE